MIIETTKRNVKKEHKKMNIKAMSVEEVVRLYQPLVKKVAYSVLNRLPSGVEFEDLLQTGMVGLIEAINNYDENKGASFATYASIRIRGHILDDLRKLIWMPRSVHANSCKIAKAKQDIERKTGRRAQDREIAKELQVNVNEYQTMDRECNEAKMFGIEESGIRDDALSQGYAGKVSPPQEEVSALDESKSIMQAIDCLPEKERDILNLYYHEDKNLKEIGELFDVTESRVCQIHTQAVTRLRTRIAG